MPQWIQWKTQSGSPIHVEDVIVTPQSQTLSLITPFGGFVWNRPTAVLVEQNGQNTTHPIPDITRTALIVIAIFVFILLRR